MFSVMPFYTVSISKDALLSDSITVLLKKISDAFTGPEASSDKPLILPPELIFALMLIFDNVTWLGPSKRYKNPTSLLL